MKLAPDDQKQQVKPSVKQKYWGVLSTVLSGAAQSGQWPERLAVISVPKHNGIGQYMVYSKKQQNKMRETAVGEAKHKEEVGDCQLLSLLQYVDQYCPGGNSTEEHIPPPAVIFTSRGHFDVVDVDAECYTKA